MSDACQPSFSSGRRRDALAALDDEEAHAVVAAVLRGLGGGDDRVGADAVGDEDLRAVEHVAAVDLFGLRGDAGHVAAGAGLGDRERGDLVAGDAGGEVLLLLLGRAELPDRSQRDARVGPEPGGDSAASAGRELFKQDRVGEVALGCVVGSAGARSAVLLFKFQPQVSLRGDLLEDAVGEVLGVFPLVGVGKQICRHPPMNRVPEVLEFLRVRRGDVLGHTLRARCAA